MFSSSYSVAAEQFCSTAANRGFEVKRHLLPGSLGIDGEQLSIDVATKGRGDQLILLSGVHGPEGYAGSACQIECMKRFDFEGHRIVMIHAVNPYGFSYSTRANENRVDLNRNFSGSYPAEHNEMYSEVHVDFARFAGAGVTAPPDRAVIDQWFKRWEDRLGTDTFAGVLVGGQHRHDDGLYFGGRERQPSVKLLDSILDQHRIGGVGRALTIDFHTGLGPSGHGELLYSGARGSSSHGPAEEWLGERITCTETREELSELTSKTNVAMFGRADFAEQVGFAALEYGTVPFHDVMAALCGDIWLRNNPRVDQEVVAAVRKQTRDAFYVRTTAWESAVVGRAVQLVERATASLRR